MPSTSSTRESCRLTAAQSSTTIPPGLSMKRRSMRPPFAACSSTSSYPMPDTTGSTIASSAAITRSLCAANKKWAEAHLSQRNSKLLKFNRNSLAGQPPHRCRWELAPASWIEIARQLDRPAAPAQQPAHARADGLEHAPHLAVAPLLQGHAIPAIGALASLELDALESGGATLLLKPP